MRGMSMNLARECVWDDSGFGARCGRPWWEHCPVDKGQDDTCRMLHHTFKGD